MEPTVGRIVYYIPAEEDTQLNQLRQDQPLAAVVTFVHPKLADGTQQLNLCVMSPYGLTFPKRFVTLVGPDEKYAGTEEFCHWMPYQVEQAKKEAGVQTLQVPKTVPAPAATMVAPSK